MRRRSLAQESRECVGSLGQCAVEGVSQDVKQRTVSVMLFSVTSHKRTQ